MKVKIKPTKEEKRALKINALEAKLLKCKRAIKQIDSYVTESFNALELSSIKILKEKIKRHQKAINSCEKKLLKIGAYNERKM